MASNATSSKQNKGYKFCLEHITKELLMLCLDCNMTFVCTKCIATKHIGHRFLDLEDKTQQDYNKLQDFETKVSTEILPRLEDGVNVAESALSDNMTTIAEEKQKIEEQRIFFKGIIDSIADTNLAELDCVRVKNSADLEQYISTTKACMQKLTNKIKENKTAMRSDNDVLVIESATETFELNVNGTQLDFHEIKFNSGDSAVMKEQLETGFGSLSTNIKNIVPHIQILPFPVENLDPLSNNRPKTQSSLRVAAKKKTSDRITETNIPLRKPPTSSTTSTDGIIYFCAGCTLYRYDVTTSKFQWIECDRSINDICFHPVNNVLYGVSVNNICRINTTNGRTYEILNIKNVVCMTILTTGKIVLGKKGSTVLELYHQSNRKLEQSTDLNPFSPYKLTSCSTTGTIAVVVRPPAVMCVNANLANLVRITSASSMINRNIHVDVKFDVAGNALIGDSNGAVHIAEVGTGTILRTLRIFGSGELLCIALQQSENRILAFFHNPNKVMSVQYR